jgi:hypothetical protein
MSKLMKAATKRGIKKRGRPRRRWREEVQEGLNIMGIRSRQVMVRNRRDWRKTALKSTVQNGL